MSVRLLVAAAAVIAAPMAVMGQPITTAPKQPSERRYCVVDNDPANRLRRISRCYTKAERDQMKQEARRNIDRIQTMRTSN
jgi:hypothetical protein